MTMPPLVDTHCHLLAGLDDGPRTPDDAIAMCRKAYDQGVRHSVALAHQNDEYPRQHAAADSAGIRQARRRSCAPRTCRTTSSSVPRSWSARTSWTRCDRGELLTFGDAGKYLLFEMPHGLCVEVGWVIERFVDEGRAADPGPRRTLPGTAGRPGRRSNGSSGSAASSRCRAWASRTRPTAATSASS